MRRLPSLLPRFSRPLAAPLAIAVYALMVVAGIWAIAFFFLDADRRNLYRDARAELAGAHKVMAAQVGRTVESAQSLLHAVDHWLGEHARDPGPDALPNLATLVDRLQRQHESPALIRLYGADGETIPLGPLGAGEPGAAGREFITGLEGKPEGTIHIGLQFTGRMGRALIPLSMRASANPFGARIIVTAIDVSSFVDAFADTMVTAPGLVGIVREDGHILFRHPDVESATGIRLDLAAWIRGNGDPPVSGLLDDIVDLRGRQLLTAFRKLANQPLYVYATFRVNELEAKLAQRAPLTIAVASTATIAVLAMAILIAWLLWRREKEAATVVLALSQAREASAAKSAFLANVSHELRTPLNAIIGFSELVAMQTFGPLQERYRGYVGDVLAAGRHLLGVVDQLLDMATIEARRFSLKSEPVDLGVLAGEAAQMLEPLAGERQVTLILRGPEGEIVTEGDAGAIRQILINLIGNAVKFCREGGKVEITWMRDDPNSVSITVADEGEGIAPEDLPLVFEPFWRKEGTYVRRHSGVGLGLALTRQLVEALDGSVTAESTPGEGSRFIVRLPA
jgi:signal transduction histidine kinase